MWRITSTSRSVFAASVNGFSARTSSGPRTAENSIS
jgi:hypothetical protein